MLQGEDLDLALKPEDYRVEIGPCGTYPTNINSTYLYVQACQDLPPKVDHNTKVPGKIIESCHVQSNLLPHSGQPCILRTSL